jgi:hypothetical protein
VIGFAGLGALPERGRCARCISYSGMHPPNFMLASPASPTLEHWRKVECQQQRPGSNKEETLKGASGLHFEWAQKPAPPGHQ